jgi:hypothetical protein
MKYSPGADQRRIADTTPALGGQPAGRGRGGDMAMLVHRDRPDGAIFDVGIEPPVGKQLVQLAPPLDGNEPVIGDLFKTGFAREVVGSAARQEDMRPLLHQPPG